MQVLYIEDHPNNVLLIQRIVKAEGHTFLHAIDGESGRLALQTNRPDLIFVDLRLPGKIDGYELIRYIKSKRALKNIPVVVLTAFGYGDAERKAEEAGCDAFIHKPADIREVRAIIRQYLGDPILSPVLSSNGRSWANLPVPK
jgi:two-component system cell cycle response regulator DivK